MSKLLGVKISENVTNKRAGFAILISKNVCLEFYLIFEKEIDLILGQVPNTSAQK